MESAPTRAKSQAHGKKSQAVDKKDNDEVDL
jgi:hypothetical protein